MDKDEKELLIRIDERLNEVMTRHVSCDIPDRIQQLERKSWRVEGGIALLIFLVGSTWIVNLIYGLFRLR